MSCISRVNLCPAFGDTENVLLQKILQSLNAGGGGGGGGSGTVTSVNGDPGPAVFLDSGEIPESSNLYFTTGRVRATDLSGLILVGGAVTAADTILDALGKFQFRVDALETGASGPYLLKAGDTGTGAFFFTPTADNVTPLTLSNSITGASAVPTLAINPTWNTTGDPTALLINATDTASSTQAELFDAQLNTVSVLTLRKDGRLSLQGRLSATDITGVGQIFNSLNATTGSTPTAVIIQHNLSSGIPVVGFGVTLDWNLDSTTTPSTLAARLITQWTDPAHATRTSQQIFQQFVSGTLLTSLTLFNGQLLARDGSAPFVSYGFATDLDTGMFRAAVDTLGFSASGTTRLTLSTTLLTTTVPIQQSDSTALVADPTAASTQQSVAGEWQYRSSAASEGAGQMNRVHNRGLLVVGAGTDYTLTGTSAAVIFGTTSPIVVLPTAGTYLVMASVQALSDGAGAADVMQVSLFNSTDASSAGLGGVKLMTAAAGSTSESAMLQAIVTITATKTFTITASNLTAARGLIIAARTNISFVRLS